MNWIKNNADALKIAYVAHVGDITHYGDYEGYNSGTGRNYESDWYGATTTRNIIENCNNSIEMS